MDFKKNPDANFKDIEDLSEQKAREEAEALREGIEYHNYRYYVKNDPVISDAVFDKLFARLQKLEEARSELRTRDSPTRRVGAPPAEGLQRIEHRAPMLSLDAALGENWIQEFIDFVRRETGSKNLVWTGEPKFDGASVEVAYENGEFRTGATRGDGRVGEDISDNLATIRTLSLKLQSDSPPALLAVRGEVFLPKNAFQDLNRQRVENGEDPFANPRNACAGTIRRLDSKIVARWPLDIFFYDILVIDGEEFSSHWEELKTFKSWGLKTKPLNRLLESFEELAAFREVLIEKRENLPYEIDGIVLKLDDLELRRQLGTRHRSPRWAMAWKFEAKKEVTVIERIAVQVGPSGMLTPVALLRPVEVGGVTVSRATLHNEGEVQKKDLREGDRVRIERAGDVIPEVVERIECPNKYAAKFHMPKKCPSCGTEVMREGAYVFCPAGLSCKAQLRGRLRHYGSREALDIEHLGEKTVEQLVERELVGSLADLYHLEQADIEKLEGYAEKSARQLLEAIRVSREPPLDRFLFALGIRHIGQRTARILASRFGILKKLANADRGELQSIPDIGPEIADCLPHFFAENRQALDDLREAGGKVRPMAKKEGEKALEGKTFVFTGSLGRFYPQRGVGGCGGTGGGRATSSVSGSTDYLVVGKNPGIKLDEAKEQGTEILDEKQFLELLTRHGKGQEP